MDINIEPKTCKQCGAPLKKTLFGYKCEYCGTCYEEDKITNELKIISVNAPVKVLRAEVCYSTFEVDSFRLCGVSTAEKARREISSAIAEEIAKEIEIVEDFDPGGYLMRYIATFRVVDPSFRF